LARRRGMRYGISRENFVIEVLIPPEHLVALLE